MVIDISLCQSPYTSVTMTETMSWPMSISHRQGWPTVHVVNIHVIYSVWLLKPSQYSSASSPTTAQLQGCGFSLPSPSLARPTESKALGEGEDTWLHSTTSRGNTVWSWNCAPLWSWGRETIFPGPWLMCSLLACRVFVGGGHSPVAQWLWLISGLSHGEIWLVWDLYKLNWVLGVVSPFPLFLLRLA